MRWLLKCLKLLLIAVCGTAVFIWFLVCGIPWLQLKTLERQTKKNVNPTELRSWALDLMAKYPEESHWDSYHNPNFFTVTNFPAGLQNVHLFKNGFHVLSSSNDVALFGAGKGEPFIQIGRPSFAAPTNMPFRQWEPGMYFIGE
jgi:hypothetical protein